MGAQTIGAVFDSLFGIPEAAAAVFSQAVQGAVAEEAAESFRICTGMTGKIFAFLILKEIIICHFLHSALFNLLDTWYNAINIQSRENFPEVLGRMSFSLRWWDG